MINLNFDELHGLEVMLARFPERNENYGTVFFGHVLGEYNEILFLEPSRESYPMTAAFPLQRRRPDYELSPRHPLEIQRVLQYDKRTIAQVEELKTARREYAAKEFGNVLGKEILVHHSGYLGKSNMIVEGIIGKDFGPFLILEEALEIYSKMDYEREYINEFCLIPTSNIIRATRLITGALQFRKYDEFRGRKINVHSQKRVVLGGHILGEGRQKILLADPASPADGVITIYKEAITAIHTTEDKKRNHLTLAVNNGVVDLENAVDPVQRERMELYSLLKVNPWSIQGKDDFKPDTKGNISL